MGHAVLRRGVGDGTRPGPNGVLSPKKAVHDGRTFPHCVEKHNELLPDERPYAGRVVFEGSFVSDQSLNAAVFGELASSASLMSARRVT